VTAIRIPVSLEKPGLSLENFVKLNLKKLQTRREIR
jgi:hypothetical protein